VELTGDNVCNQDSSNSKDSQTAISVTFSDSENVSAGEDHLFETHVVFSIKRKEKS
jgi:hypothetical protein